MTRLLHVFAFTAVALTGLFITLGMSTRARGEAAAGVTYFVRPDGGSTAQCTGIVNAPYPGSGETQPCAWDHPFRALPPGGSPRIAGGDTLLIAAGNYMIGYGAPGAEPCDAGGAFACTMLPIPSGLNVSNPTRILGAGWNSGCANPPQRSAPRLGAWQRSWPETRYRAATPPYRSGCPRTRGWRRRPSRSTRRPRRWRSSGLTEEPASFSSPLKTLPWDAMQTFCARRTRTRARRSDRFRGPPPGTRSCPIGSRP